MDHKLLGSILLIVGTCIGAGMLALPIASAELGFGPAMLLLFFCWFVMTMGAFLTLEVILWMPLNSNINTMARMTIGPLGQLISWVSFLFLLYTLLCAYVAGGSDLFHHLLTSSGLALPHWYASVLFTLIFGSIIWMGVRSVDYVNRGLMLLKFSSFFLLVFLLLPHISVVKLMTGNLYHITSPTAIMVTITSFGFAAIIPSVRIYLQGDISRLKKAIMLGSLIPLLCYIAWNAVIMGVIPLDKLSGLLKSPRSTSQLAISLDQAAGSTYITVFMNAFTSICVLTSFLGVALALTDFWADALQVDKRGRGNILVCLLALLPPLFIVIFFPGIFVKAIAYAGMDSIFLLVLMPVWMTWYGRYRRNFSGGFTVPIGKPLLLLLAFFCIILLIHAS